MISFPRLGEMGRLGNQMFQVAATVAHALRVGTEPAFPDWPYKNVFDVPLGWFGRECGGVSYIERAFSFSRLPDGDERALEGYFQSPRYFEDVEHEIRRIFQTRTPAFPKLPRRVGIHVRRGDYLAKPDYHRNLPLAYYDVAIGEIESIVHPMNYLVSSDDMDWCRHHFIGPRFSFMTDDLEDWEAMLALASCEALIIANSAFSWWAAWLCDSPYKTVVSPSAKLWFGPAGPQDTQDLLPSEWHQVAW